MQGLARSVALTAIALVVIAVSAAPAAAQEPDLVADAPVQLSLGDSWPAGARASDPSEGYVPQLNEALKEQYNCSGAAPNQAQAGCKHLQLVNLAVGGATTPTLIANQLPAAEGLLESRNDDGKPRNDVEVVTLHIGGNDVTNPIINACLINRALDCPGTIETELAAYANDLDQALSRLRAAAGQEARIVIGTYDNPIGSCFLAQLFPGEAVPLADLVLAGGSLVLSGESLVVEQGLHDIMREVGGDHGVEVADVYGDLAPQDWFGGTDCLHPVDSGYDKVTDAFLEVLLAPR
jgi:lysophospholipase L1-like esterase